MKFPILNDFEHLLSKGKQVMKVFWHMYVDVVVGNQSLTGQPDWVNSAEIMRVKTYHLEI